MPVLLIIVAVGVGVASLLIFVILTLFAGSEATDTEQRLQSLVGHGSRRAAAAPQQASLLRSGEAQGPLDQLADKWPQLRLLLQQADVAISPAGFLLISLSAFAAGSSVAALAPLTLLLVPVIGAVVAALPWLVVLHLRKQRLERLGRQLPEALELLSRSLRAGHSLAAGIGLVGQEMSQPLGREFQRVFDEQNLGIALDEALEDLADRVPNMDLRFFATAVILQRTTGGDLAEILDKIGHLIRGRLQILGQVNALTGEGRLSGVVLLAMPPALFLFMLRVNREYVMTLFQDEIGQKMLAIAVIAQLLGAVVIKKIITIKV